MYSQNDEEKYIIDYFKNQNGRFLDIGAYNGVNLSNTRQLALNGWSGVLVEPCPSNFKELADIYRNNNNIILINAALSITNDLSPFYYSFGDAISSLRKDQTDKFCPDNMMYYIKPITISEIFDKFGYDFDFIDIDIEGMDLLILKQLDFSKLTNLKMICIEPNDYGSEIIRFLNNLNFKILHETSENYIFVKENKSEAKTNK